MPLPDRPVDDAEIETAWGQEIHDRVLAASGCEVYGTTRTVGSTPLRVDLDTAASDPGGFLGTDQLVMPANSEGLYLAIVRLISVDGDVGDMTRCYIYLNASPVASGIEDNNGGVNITVTVVALLALTAGDVLEIYGQRKGSGTTPTVNVQSFQLLRLTDAYGA